MKRRNAVFLAGLLQAVVTRTEVAAAAGCHGDGERQVLVGTIVTDFQACGGYHQVLFLEQQAIEALVFQQCATHHSQASLTVTVDGWLRSDHLPHAVVVDRVKFDVAESVRKQAVQRLQEIFSGQVIPAAPMPPPNGNGARSRLGTHVYGNPVGGGVNYVSLAGYLRSVERTRTVVGAVRLPGAFGYLETDAAAYGARHPVSFPYNLAAQALAACESGRPVEVALEGWLWSDPLSERHKVHATHVQFL